MNILAECNRRDIRIEANGDMLKVDAPKGALSPDLLALLKEHKADLLAALQAEDLRESFEERAAIMEHDGGLSRAEAELEAAKITAVYARNKSYSWGALHKALPDGIKQRLPNKAGIVDSLPLGVASWACMPNGRAVRQGIFNE